MDYTKGYMKARDLADQIVATATSGKSVKGLGGSRAIKRTVNTEDAEYDQELFAPLSVGSVSSFFEAPDGEDIKAYLESLYATEEEPRRTESGELRPASRGDMLTSDIGKNLMADIKEAYGLTDEQAAGLVGNLAHETGDFKFMQEIEPMIPGSKGGWGFAQWTGQRRKDFEQWTSDNNLDPSSYEANLGFLMHEIDNTSEGRFMEDLKKAETVEDAARIVSDKYLRPGKPNMSSRIARAYGYMELQ